MPRITDLDVTPKEVVELASPDAITAFLARLGYETDDRAVLSPEAVGLTGESASAIKRIELLSEDPEQFLRVLFAQPKSLTAKVRVRRSQVKLYDPENQPIVACSQEDWDLAVRTMSSGRMRRLSEFCTAYQGEVNETTDGKKGSISESPKDGPLFSTAWRA